MWDLLLHETMGSCLFLDQIMHFLGPTGGLGFSYYWAHMQRPEIFVKGKKKGKKKPGEKDGWFALLITSELHQERWNTCPRNSWKKFTTNAQKYACIGRCVCMHIFTWVLCTMKSLVNALMTPSLQSSVLRCGPRHQMHITQLINACCF